MATNRTAASEAAKILATDSWNPLHGLRKKAAARTLNERRQATSKRSMTKSGRTMKARTTKRSTTMKRGMKKRTSRSSK